ncbi:hypothetical protein [Streptomyces sp. AJS327]|uniref:hypothetical protein n=1 Tax=Streptomyces sp. AJS327 TaxID=2545265 RepID=UPI0015DD830B|nr:hypothetical protein [Streptomyces sp. AJS327]
MSATCPSCGATAATPSDRHCPDCGADLNPSGSGTPDGFRSAPAPEPASGEGESTDRSEASTGDTETPAAGLESGATTRIRGSAAGVTSEPLVSDAGSPSASDSGTPSEPGSGSATDSGSPSNSGTSGGSSSGAAPEDETVRGPSTPEPQPSTATTRLPHQQTAEPAASTPDARPAEPTTAAPDAQSAPASRSAAPSPRTGQSGGEGQAGQPAAASPAGDAATPAPGTADAEAAASGAVPGTAGAVPGQQPPHAGQPPAGQTPPVPQQAQYSQYPQSPQSPQSPSYPQGAAPGAAPQPGQPHPGTGAYPAAGAPAGYPTGGYPAAGYPAVGGPAAQPHPGGLPQPPAPPSALGQFLVRTFTGDWGGSAKAAVPAVLILLAAAAGLAIPSDEAFDEADIGYGTRLRYALALLLQGVGGSVELTGRAEWADAFFSIGAPSESDSTMTLGLLPLSSTVLFVLTLWIGSRLIRRGLETQRAHNTAGVEHAVRVSLLSAAGVLLLSLLARPEVQDVELSNAPPMAMLGALLLAAVTTLVVLTRPQVEWWLSTRDALRLLVATVRTTLLALVIVLAIASVVTYVALLVYWRDDLDVWLVTLPLVILPNLGIHGLSIAWGAAVRGESDGSSTAAGTRTYSESASFGLSELGDAVGEHGDLAIAGAVAGGLLCALVLGVLAARRLPGRGLPLLAGGLFLGAVLLGGAVGDGRAELQVTEGSSSQTPDSDTPTPDEGASSDGGLTSGGSDGGFSSGGSDGGSDGGFSSSGSDGGSDGGFSSSGSDGGSDGGFSSSGGSDGGSDGGFSSSGGSGDGGLAEGPEGGPSGDRDTLTLSVEGSVDTAELLLFGLLWTMGATLLVPFVASLMRGERPGGANQVPGGYAPYGADPSAMAGYGAYGPGGQAGYGGHGYGEGAAPGQTGWAPAQQAGQTGALPAVDPGAQPGGPWAPGTPGAPGAGGSPWLDGKGDPGGPEKPDAKG